MNIYIKTFNRPFYLDRCIQSIKFNVRNYDKIIILEDGTLKKYQDKLINKHPEIIFVRSNADDEKFELLKQERYDEIKRRYIEPAKFWFHELNKEQGEYFFLLEDDTWIVRQIDLAILESNMKSNNCVMMQTWWAPNAGGYSIYNTYYSPSQYKVEYYQPDFRDIDSLYQIWIVCMAIFRKDYFLHNFKGIKRMGDEYSQLLHAYDYVNEHAESTFAKTNNKIVYQGWATPGRATSEYVEKGLQFYYFMECFNEAWFEDNFDVLEGYPFDFSYSYLLSKMQNKIPSKSMEAWKEWRQKEVSFNYD